MKVCELEEVFNGDIWVNGKTRCEKVSSTCEYDDYEVRSIEIDDDGKSLFAWIKENKND